MYSFSVFCGTYHKNLVYGLAFSFLYSFSTLCGTALSLSSISLFLGKKNVKSKFFDGNLSWLLVFQVDYGL